MVAKKDVHLAKHPELADKNVPNLHVMKAMQVRKWTARPEHENFKCFCIVGTHSIRAVISFMSIVNADSVAWGLPDSDKKTRGGLSG